MEFADNRLLGHAQDRVGQARQLGHADDAQRIGIPVRNQLPGCKPHFAAQRQQLRSGRVRHMLHEIFERLLAFEFNDFPDLGR